MTTFKAIGDDLLQSIDAALPSLTDIDERRASQPGAPGKWSPKQVLGHLIDSASNNHQRFVRAQQPGNLHLPGYVQDHWVRVQHYNGRPWSSLIELWAAYNRHLAHVIACIPESAQETTCSIDPYPAETLGFIASDYVVHLWHHLNQVGIARPSA
ncbi:MAG TPA: DinB family protein [Gemmatimonadales bacterium]|nr:DinB family protein [Gemmatimonadales bacterium]